MMIGLLGLSMIVSLFLTLYSVRRGASNPFEFRIDRAQDRDIRLNPDHSRWSERQALFESDARYRVTTPATPGLVAGEVLIFEGATYNQFSRAWIYTFACLDGSKKLWRLTDDTPPGTWRDYFERE